MRCSPASILLSTLSAFLYGCGGSSSPTPVTPPPVVSTANEWTWESGTGDPFTGFGQPGVYGTIGTPAAANVPGARGVGASWADSSGNLWLYAGYGLDSGTTPGFLSDIWKYSIASSQWTWIAGADTINAEANYGTQGVEAPTNQPGARSNFTSSTDASGNLWVFGGTGLDASGAQSGLGDFWKFNSATVAWTWIGGSSGPFPNGQYGTLGVAASGNIPGERQAGISWTDANGKVWLFGGYGATDPITQPVTGVGEDFLNDLWVFDPATTLWTWMAGSDAGSTPGIYGTLGVTTTGAFPGARQSAQVSIDASGNVWLFGGVGYDAQGNRSQLNDLWQLNPTTMAWTWMAGSNTADAPGIYGVQGVAATANAPGARAEAVMWIDDTGKLWLMGGYGYASSGSAGDLSDLWSFDPTAKQWTWMGGSSSTNSAGVYGTLGVANAANAPAARSGAVPMKDASGNLWLFGGYGATAKGPDQVALNDLWQYQP